MDKHFIFNGICSEEYNLICGFVGGNSDNFFSAGCQTDLQTESNYNGSVHYIISNKYIDIKINIRLKCKTEIYKMLVEEK